MPEWNSRTITRYRKISSAYWWWETASDFTVWLTGETRLEKRMGSSTGLWIHISNSKSTDNCTKRKRASLIIVDSKSVVCQKSRQLVKVSWPSHDTSAGNGDMAFQHDACRRYGFSAVQIINIWEIDLICSGRYRDWKEQCKAIPLAWCEETSQRSWTGYLIINTD